MIWAIAILTFLILLTYVIFPAITILLANYKKEVFLNHPHSRNRIFIVMAVHNEELVIREKLESILHSKYEGEIHCFIGSDASTDQTAIIINEFKATLDIHFIEFDKRSGKPAIINQLIEKINSQYQIVEEDLFLLTDANVILSDTFIQEMANSFYDKKIGLVDGLVQNPDQPNLIGESEGTYIQLETALKAAEGKLWNCSMGPFGGAYMVRANLYKQVPTNFLVDDFFIFYHVLKQGKGAVVNKKAMCFETVPGSTREEFRRKVRISAGNFQNTFYYLSEIIQVWKPHNRVFIIHKLLRWMSPMLTICLLILLGIGGMSQPILFSVFLIMICLLVGLPLINYLLNQLNLKSKYLHGFTYFIMMNLALSFGFIQFIKGIRTNVWEPTKRNVST